MNREIKQMSDIVISARKALYENNRIDYVPSKVVLSIKFIFSRKFLDWRTVEVNSVDKWFDLCKQRGLLDVKFFIPTVTNERHLLGFANTSMGTIVCFWKNGKTSCFSPAWCPDSEENGWNVIYEERVLSNVQKKEISFVGRKDEFKQILSDIGRFAADMDFSYFVEVFHKAYEVLSDSKDYVLEDVPTQLPSDMKGIYYAVEVADVFGAMGSWNDAPSYYAEEKGLQKEYNELSDRLLQQVRYHLMYVTNECWKVKTKQ